MRLVIALLVGCIVGAFAGSLAGCRSAPAHTIAWQSPVEIAKGGGTKGPWQQNQSRFDYVDDPSVVVLPDGTAAVVWADHRDKDIHFRSYAPDGSPRAAAINLSRSRDIFSWLPRIVVSPRDPRALFVLWQEIVFSGGSHGGEIFFARSLDGGRTFSTPQNLSRSLGGDGKGRLTKDIWHNGSLDLAIAPDATLYAAWTEYDGALWFTSSHDAGESFAAPTQVAGSVEQPARAPSLAVGRDGAVYLAWTYGESDSADIHVAVRAGDRFTTPVVVAKTPGYSDAPALAVDRDDTLHVAYAESTGRFGQPRIYYAQSRDRAKTFTRASAISPAGAAFPALELDGRGRVVVLWERVVDAHGRSRGLGLAISRDGGAQFSTTDVVPHSVDPAGGFNGSHQGHLMDKLAVGDDSIAIVNSSLAAGRGSRVWLLRGRL